MADFCFRTMQLDNGSSFKSLSRSVGVQVVESGRCNSVLSRIGQVIFELKLLEFDTTVVQVESRYFNSATVGRVMFEMRSCLARYLSSPGVGFAGCCRFVLSTVEGILTLSRDRDAIALRDRLST